MTDRRTRRFWRLPPSRRLLAWGCALAAACAVSLEGRRWNLLAPGGVLAAPRPVPEFPDVASDPACGFWDGTDPLTESELRSSVWVFYTWTFG